MANLSSYYARAKSGIAGINPKEAADLAEDWLVTGATGAALGLMAASFQGGLDTKVAGIEVPLDGLLSLGLGFAGLQTRSRQLQVASIAAGGSAAARVFTRFFQKGIGTHGEAGQFDGSIHPQMGWGWGAEGDRLIEAAKYL